MARFDLDAAARFRILGVALGCISLVLLLVVERSAEDSADDMPQAESATEVAGGVTDLVTTNKASDLSADAAPGLASSSTVTLTQSQTDEARGRLVESRTTGRQSSGSPQPTAPLAGARLESGVSPDDEYLTSDDDKALPASNVVISPLTTTTVALARPTYVAPTTSTTVNANSVPASTSTTLGPNDVLLRIPLGTKTRIDGGDPVNDVMPTLLQVRLGQTLILVNDDSAFHVYGPFSIRPGESIRWRFTEIGDTVGYCTVGPSKQVTIRVSA